MYTPNKLLERELKITKAYVDNINEHKAEREFKVLEQQITSYFTSFHESDLIAGRVNRPFVVFSPCMESGGLDQVAYAIDEPGCLKALEIIENDPSYSSEYADQVRDMIAFWHEENTNTKIRKRIPEAYLFAMPTDDYLNESSAIHPLYRIAGVNLDFKKLYKYGLSGLIKLISDKMAHTDDEDKLALYSAMSKTLALFKIVIKQYLENVAEEIHLTSDSKRLVELEKMKTSLNNLLDNAPKNFQEALQLQTLYMLAGRNVEIGRLDDYMGEIYRDSLLSGEMTKAEAIRLLDNFFTIIETQYGRDTRAIIGGFGRENEKAADEFALLVLDVLEIRKLNFYPQVSLRYYKGINPEIYNRSLKIISEGCTFPMLYNDDVNVPSVMRAMDVPRKLAEKYSFFGCGEYMLAEHSVGTPNTALNVAKVLELTLNGGIDPATKTQMGLKTELFTNETSYEQLNNMYQKQLDFFCDISGTFQELVYDVCNEESAFLLMSILQNDCIERGKGLLDGGIHHLGGTVETYGNVTAYDSMTTIKQVVYDKKLMTQEKLLDMLNADFQGFEKEQLILKNASKFGNDDDFADEVSAEWHEYICNAIRYQKDRTRLDSFLVVVINNSMNTVFGKFTGATPDGRKNKALLSNGNSAYPGRDKNGLTSLLNSMSKLDTSIHAGATQNLKISSELFSKNNLEDIKAIIATFFDNGGQQLSLSIVNQADLEDALIHPEKHENLIVRVGGFSARFIHLDPAIQLDMLTRTAY